MQEGSFIGVKNRFWSTCTFQQELIKNWRDTEWIAIRKSKLPGFLSWGKVSIYSSGYTLFLVTCTKKGIPLCASKKIWGHIRWKVLSLAYNRCEIRGRDLDQSWCHCHTSVKLFLLTARGIMDISGSIQATCPEFYVGCRLGQELFTLPSYMRSLMWICLRSWLKG